MGAYSPSTARVQHDGYTAFEHHAGDVIVWLDDLARLFAGLRSRATEYGTELRRNEALTRAALIDPVLVQLGWDVHDPGQMIPEYHAGRGRVDYALFDG